MIPVWLVLGEDVTANPAAFWFRIVVLPPPTKTNAQFPLLASYTMSNPEPVAILAVAFWAPLICD
ncbi:hypothetical protein SAMN05216337_104275 [Bradyrhizobium brasilense]|uniref:Uncharacterized protein n=1 Tax=Bradyrhizobium brasilense TaxID=1419277 RepID=A0A1G7HNN7_9BRAD|nr:hypothetical protein SAMN05216337_104275 [Bradyrhizobium brasilense]